MWPHRRTLNFSPSHLPYCHAHCALPWLPLLIAHFHFTCQLFTFFFFTCRFKPLRSAAAAAAGAASVCCLLTCCNMQQQQRCNLLLRVWLRLNAARVQPLSFPPLSLFSPFCQLDQTAFISDQKVVYSAHIRWENKMIFLFASSTSCKQREKTTILWKKETTNKNIYITFDLPLVRLLH